MAGRPVPEWETTQLWRELKGRDDPLAERLIRALAPILENAERLLGDTAPPAFTLHDAGHSRRVADRIFDIAGPHLISKMEPYDLGLLLLGAYLHDIGMAPPLARVDSILAFLMTGNRGHLPEAEIESLQAWLDNEAAGRIPALDGGEATHATLREAKALTAHYVRFRHNEWGGEWMRENLSDLDENTYSGCLADLILLCQSHHAGISELRGDDFDPRYVGSPATVLHLRFNACLLRVADVLDFDPERTPKVLFTHRDIPENSAIFWHKDHEFSFVQSANHITIHARPSNALIHHAIDLAIEDVNRELQVCQKLAEETHFHRMAGKAQDLPHRWRLDASVRDNVKPRNDAYTYIDGTFRPDQERILQLLGGVALYGSPMAAVRELLQNAFDAVREQIAYQRLEQEDPAADDARARIADTLSVHLEIRQSSDGVTLRCTDSGVGMSQEIISSRLLVGGSTASHETRALERTCEAKGFRVGRTARFGIGVLAYFLLASEVTIHTRRSIQAGDPDSIGWTFSSHGLADFGELKRNTSHGQGTTVELLIRDDAMPLGVDRFIEDLELYVEGTVRHVPCHFRFTSSEDSIEFFSDPGWPDRTAEANAVFLSSMRDRLGVQRDLELLTHQRRQTLESEKSRWDTVRQKGWDSLQTIVVENDLPNNLGRFRLFVGYFETRGVATFPYLDLFTEPDGTYSLAPVVNKHGVEPGHSVSMSWNGMKVEAEEESRHRIRIPVAHDMPGVVLEVDWASDVAGELAVHRNSIRLSQQGQEAVKFAEEKASAIMEDLLHQDLESSFALINGRAASLDNVPIGKDQLWPETVQLYGSHGAALKKVKLITLETPIIEVQRKVGGLQSDFQWKGARAIEVPDLTLAEGIASSYRSWHDFRWSPQIIGVIRDEGEPRPIPIWTDLPREVTPRPQFLKAKFPPQWLDLLSVEIGDEPEEGELVWNEDHPVIKAMDLSSWSWAEELGARVDPLAHAEDLLASPQRLAAWIRLAIEKGQSEIWDGLCDRAPDFLYLAWDMIGLAADRAIHTWGLDFEGPVLNVISPDGWEGFGGPDSDYQFEEAFEVPADEWWVQRIPKRLE